MRVGKRLINDFAKKQRQANMARFKANEVRRMAGPSRKAAEVPEVKDAAAQEGLEVGRDDDKKAWGRTLSLRINGDSDQP